MIDMGNHKGKHLFYAGGKSIAELIEAGEIVGVPSPEGVVYKRTERATPLELAAAYTLEELREMEKKTKDGEV